jgi:hypothetical protein
LIRFTEIDARTFPISGLSLARRLLISVRQMFVLSRRQARASHFVFAISIARPPVNCVTVSTDRFNSHLSCDAARTELLMPGEIDPPPVSHRLGRQTIARSVVGDPPTGL